MPYVFKQDIIDALINDDGSFTVGTLFDRAWFQSILSDFNAGFRIAKTDAEPSVDIDAVQHGIVAGLGGNSAPDTGLFRGPDGWRSRNAGNTVFRQVEGGDPTTPQAFVTRAYFEAVGGVVPGSVPVGSMLEFVALVDPGVQPDGSEFIIPDGRTLDRATYAELNLLLFDQNYPFGDGNGATTFNVPTRLGLIGIGTAGTPGLGMGEQAGSWDHVHVYTVVPEHDHVLSDPGHDHALVDPGHFHPVSDPGHGHAFSDPGHVHVIDDPGHAHVLNDPGHGHSILDPGHQHGLTGASHTHGVIDPGHDHGMVGLGSHTHPISDPGHGHGTSNDSHSHGISDPQHSHGITDPQHTHQSGSFVAQAHSHGAGSLQTVGRSVAGTASGSNINFLRDVSGGVNLAVEGATANETPNVQGTSGSRKTDITVNNSGTGVGVNSAASGVTINASTTGIFVTGSTDLGNVDTDGSVTGITLAPTGISGDVDPNFTDVLVVDGPTGVNLDPAFTGIGLDPAFTGASVDPDSTGVTVDPEVTGATVATEVTGISVQNAGSVAPSTEPANPPVVGLGYILRVL